MRLDSLAPGRDGRSFAFRDFRGEIVAYHLDEVLPAVRAVEAAAAGGLHAAGLIAYEAAPAFEARFATGPPGGELPLVWFATFAERVEVEPASFASIDLPPLAAAGVGGLRPSTSEQAYRDALVRILDWIAAGDAYQVNHTFRLRGSLAGDEDALYRRLCAAQRGPFCAHLRLPRHSVLSASPELFFRWTGDHLETRPMKGTRPRGRWSAEDRALAAELLASDKERAENLMIVDLLRNDAGRISEFGSVRVPRLFEVESFPTVHQLTSTVHSRTRPGTRLEDVLRALFPSGSVTGAPKLRASEIIAELEDSPRGVYTGAIGFVSPDDAVFSVAIRTVVLDRRSGELELGVGSGITADSVAAAEYRECLDKAEFAARAPAEFRLLESIRFEEGRGCPLLEEHLARMGESADYFGFRFDAGRVRARVEAFAEGLAERTHKLRVLLGRDGEAEVESEVIRPRTGPLRVAVSGSAVDERDPFLFHKTTRRETYRSRATDRPDCDDVLLVNRAGAITEATTANVVARVGGELLTPPLEEGLLPGVLRARLLARGEIRERRLLPEDLAAAEALFLINSVRGWQEAVLVT